MGQGTGRGAGNQAVVPRGMRQIAMTKDAEGNLVPEGKVCFIQS